MKLLFDLVFFNVNRRKHTCLARRLSLLSSRELLKIIMKIIYFSLGRLLTPAPFEEDCQRPVEPTTPHGPTLTTHSDAFDGRPQTTKPMTTSAATTISTTWPTWTEKPYSTSRYSVKILYVNIFTIRVCFLTSHYQVFLHFIFNNFYLNLKI